MTRQTLTHETMTRRLLTTVVVDPEAHEQYILGRYHQRRALQQNFDSALVYFQRALALDSTFAPAWAGLADIYVDLAEYHLMPASAALPASVLTLPPARANSIRPL